MCEWKEKGIELNSQPDISTNVKEADFCYVL